MQKLIGLALCFALSLIGCSSQGGGNPTYDDGGNPTKGDGGNLPQADLSHAPLHVTIGFDELADCTAVTTQYAAHVTFTADPGATILASAIIDVGQSKPNFLASVKGGCSGDYKHEFHLAFAHPVDHLRLNAVGVDYMADSATFQVTYGGGQTASKVLAGNGHDTVPVPVDLSSFAGVTQLDVVMVNDIAGIGLDDLAFDE